MTTIRTPQLPAIKFFKAAAADIRSGAKTLEPRARSAAWVKKIQTAERAQLTYGPRIGIPTVIAVVRLLDVTVRGLDTATQADVDRIGSEWKGRDPADFVKAYSDWYRPQLDKGYPVAWIAFEVIDQEPAP